MLILCSELSSNAGAESTMVSVLLESNLENCLKGDVMRRVSDMLED